jgi:hypothetical protein
MRPAIASTAMRALLFLFLLLMIFSRLAAT